nr:PREDICTED: mas-related G-protein coupled receptor member G [Rhinolophus sinicus]
MFGLWTTFSSVVFYLTLAVSLGGLVGNGLVLWHLGFHIKKGPFSVYVLHLAAADFLFLCCHVVFSIVQAAQGSQNTLYFVVTFIGFATGLWLLASFSLELCLSEVFPTCYQSCRPRHTSGIVCSLIWALSLPAVLLPAHACGQLKAGARPLACLRYHAASITWLLALACVACVAGLVLLVWVACCSRRPRPKFYSVILGSVLLLIVCSLPYVLYWSLRPLLNFLLPIFASLATLLACVQASSKTLIYFTSGRQRGKREPMRAVLQRALGDGDQQGIGGLSLPMSAI